MKHHKASSTVAAYLLYFLLSAVFIQSTSAQLSVAEIFSDHMVLQRDHPITIWGIAVANATVSINFQGSLKRSKTNAEGRWKVSFPPMDAGGPYKISINSGAEAIELDDVYVGDVWLCSGQSNMEWTIANSMGLEATIEGATDKMIRHIKVPHAYSEQPADNLPDCNWVVTSSEVVPDFTAVGYHFAKNLRKHHNVAIGLLNSSWGGSRIEAWMSAESLGEENATKIVNQMKKEAEKIHKERLRVLNEKFPGLGTEDKGMVGNKILWAGSNLNDNDWISMNIPSHWEEQGLQGFDGIGWYRIKVELNKSDLKGDAKLRLGKIDDSDKVWVNNHYVGGVDQAWNKIREYNVKKELLLEGINVIAVRVEDTGGGGGIYGETTDLFLKTAERNIDLAGMHKFKAGAFLKFNPTTNVHQTPTLLYNKMIYPILDFPIKGVIWYQGESNAGNKSDAYSYRDLFKNMINDWRKGWQQSVMPFMYVQLANFRQAEETPKNSYWALLRESQREALSLDNVGEAVIIDIGEAEDIHPRNKHDVGYRLSLPARKWAYDEDIVFSGPELVSYSVEGSSVILTFDQVLEVENHYGYVNGLALSSGSGEFYWAKGIITHGNKVKVWADEVVHPKQLRFGWADNPHDINLYNTQGLPASPFRLEIK